MASTKKKQKPKAKPVDPRRQLARCVKAMRAAVPAEQRRHITAENLHERVSDLIRIAERLRTAQQATEALKALGLT